MDSIKVYYRLSPKSAGAKKTKIPNATKLHCLKNAISIFGKENITVIGDNLTDELKHTIDLWNVRYIQVNFGNGADTFKKALDLAISENKDDDFVYLLEDDFLHLVGSDVLLIEALATWNCYATLYDHPDKYIDSSHGGNPQVDRGGEYTKVLKTESSHWKITNSTVMSFACRVSRLKEDLNTIHKYSNGRITDSYGMFTELRSEQVYVISSIPGYSTHCETKWLSPFVNWYIV